MQMREVTRKMIEGERGEREEKKKKKGQSK